jgi:hypothetical protein
MIVRGREEQLAELFGGRTQKEVEDGYFIG